MLTYLSTYATKIKRKLNLNVQCVSISTELLTDLWSPIVPWRRGMRWVCRGRSGWGRAGRPSGGAARRTQSRSISPRRTAATSAASTSAGPARGVYTQYGLWGKLLTFWHSTLITQTDRQTFAALQDKESTADANMVWSSKRWSRANPDLQKIRHDKISWQIINST